VGFDSFLHCPPMNLRSALIGQVACHQKLEQDAADPEQPMQYPTFSAFHAKISSERFS